MVLSRARVAAGSGAVVVLLAAFPLLGLIRRAAHLGNLVFIPVIIGYLFGGILVGGIAGLWLYDKLDWSKRSSHQCVGLIVGVVLGQLTVSSEGWPAIALGAGIGGIIGVAAASIFWMLERTVSGPAKRPYF